MWQTVKRHLFNPVDSASLAFFRIGFGVIMLWEVFRYLSKGWVADYFIAPKFWFTYWPFTFIQPWPGDGMYVHFILMGLFALFVLLGWRYRFSAAALFVLFTYFFLIDKTNYLNHFYLVSLVSFLMIWIPAHRTWSLDARRDSRIRSTTVPGWSLWLMRFQIVIPYFFGGIAKLNYDWLVRAEPISFFFSQDTDIPLIGALFLNHTVMLFMAYAGMLIDLLFVFYIFNRRTRVFGSLFVLAFHFMNSRIFEIGIFPWFSMIGLLLFYSPDWPRRILRDLSGRLRTRTYITLGGAAIGALIGALLPNGVSLVQIIIGAVAVGVVAYHFDEPFTPAKSELVENRDIGRLDAKQRRIAALLGVWVLFQVLFPLRHYLIASNTQWSEEGHRWAWRMMLRNKGGQAQFTAVLPETGEEQLIDPLGFLTRRQARKMMARPDMFVQFSRHVREAATEQGYSDVQVFTSTSILVNRREPAPLIDPAVDLASVPYPWFRAADWIIPHPAYR